ncbi:hypothetical protein [Micromonospora halophytica]|uniref:Uncharacterized protein n=1 Tax=Micromonospora halophytica TaxID=47864 RepID=A0A1C5HAP3_9ACTN|nr:hypothetical protein [Micromonospora halophytica]SCG42541.1 hypothetical protein GA0070560_103311 [Micromonospora halophytica]
MTSPAEPASNDASQARNLTRPLRELAALVLLGANAVLLFVGLIRLLAPANEYSTFSGRAGSTFLAFVGIESTVLPLLAVLLATHVPPVVGRARQITQAAVAEYAFGALFGALTFLIWLVGRLAKAEVLEALLGTLTRAAWFAIFGVAAFVAYQVWRTLYHVPKPKPQPGVYGQPQPGWPQQPAQGGFPSAGYPPPGQSGFPGPGAQYGQPAPAAAPPFGAAPQPAPPYGPPQSAPPYGSVPQSAPSFSGPNTAPPFGQPPSADPTQAIPRQPGEAGTSPAGPGGEDSDRTQRFQRDDPHFPR